MCVIKRVYSKGAFPSKLAYPAISYSFLCYTDLHYKTDQVIRP